jgi:hypothetical protein
MEVTGLTSLGYDPADGSYPFLFYFKTEITTASGANSHNKHQIIIHHVK